MSPHDVQPDGRGRSGQAAPPTTAASAASVPDRLSAAELARLRHDLCGPTAVFAGFLDELRDAVEQLAHARTPVPVDVIDRLLDEDFRPCIACLDDALANLNTVIARLPSIDDAGERRAA